MKNNNNISLKDSDFILFDKYISKEMLPTVSKISIKYIEKFNLKLFFINKSFRYRTYYLKITFKQNTVKLIPISIEEKEILKKKVTAFNFLLVCRKDE